MPSYTPHAISDRLLLSGHVLTALESGRMDMHATDYFEISAWVSAELRKLGSSVLMQVHRGAAGPVRDIIENLLHERAEPIWTMDALAHPVAADALIELIDRL